MFTPQLPEDKPTWVSRCCPSECVEEKNQLKARVKKLEDTLDSILCLVAEGPEFMTKIQLIDAVSKEGLQALKD